ncbi:Craniofacial development protein 2 [Zea mays]|jgi:hypothetical protein|uniref:Craniofacial development protein 2 n=2 Tax=Zea mays TaxID=4577 RepID=A0A8J8YKU2_MAIZE|nr:hypothetical protein ZEAMMB73_Zm00001d014910 [Zea mays]PWZ21262.1 Craniofacial development protein 2 [Zea mays]
MQRAGGVLISFVSRRQNGRGKKRRRWRTLVSSFGTQEKVANKNGVGILIDKSLKDGVVDVKRQGNRIILVKLVLGDVVLNIISAYAPQVGLNESEKRKFWKDLDGMVRAVPTNEKLFIGGYHNGHVGSTNAGYELAHGGVEYGSRDQGEDILDFVVAYNLVIANTFFRKRDSHLVTFSSGHRSSQIDFVLTRREDKQACLDCKVISRESVVPQHNLVVADFRFWICTHRNKQTKIARTKWWKLKGETSEVFKERFLWRALSPKKKM